MNLQSAMIESLPEEEDPPSLSEGKKNHTKIERISRRGKPEQFNTGRTLFFRRKYYPGISAEEWKNWRWQLSHRITSQEELSLFLELLPQEREALNRKDHPFPFSVTPYYLSLIDPVDKNSALRKTVIPRIEESRISFGESDDPLHEGEDSPTPSIVHRYPDRVLFMVTRSCSVYCRYCTRSRLVGGHGGSLKPYWEEGIRYIKTHEEVRDVLISGGDPLTLPDEDLDWLLSRIDKIPHVEIIRLGTKVPAVLPFRITPALIRILKKYNPLYLSLHFTHPDEITPESARACAHLADAGIVLGSQTVLLKEINDNVPVMMELFHRLLQIRVKPYYLYQCDPITGSGHFRTTVETGKAIMKGLRGFTSGYAVPQYIIDAPEGGGKIPILPEYNAGRDEHFLYLKNYEDRIFKYPELMPCSLD